MIDAMPKLISRSVYGSKKYNTPTKHSDNNNDNNSYKASYKAHASHSNTPSIDAVNPIAEAAAGTPQ